MELKLAHLMKFLQLEIMFTLVLVQKYLGKLQLLMVVLSEQTLLYVKIF